MRKISGLALMALMACGDKDDTGTVVDVLPTEGSWSYSGLSYTMDECGLEATFSPAALEAIVWTLALTDDGMELANSAVDPVACVLDGADFTCDVSLSVEVSEWPEGSANKGDPDVTTESQGTVLGTFSDEENGSLTLRVTSTCEGADCEAYLTERGTVSPCTTELATDFVYTGE